MNYANNKINNGDPKNMEMPQSFPIGIKILRKDDPFPDGVVRPGKFGIKVALYQWT